MSFNLNRTPNKVRRAAKLARAVREWAEHNQRFATTKAYHGKADLSNMDAVTSAVLQAKLKAEGISADIQYNGKAFFVSIDDKYLIDVAASRILPDHKVAVCRLDYGKKRKPSEWYCGERLDSWQAVSAHADRSVFWAPSYAQRAIRKAIKSL